MKRHLNNKGYMLVEIILSSVLAMGVAYFITDLTIKLKNKNDDLLVKTLVATDQAIIYNTIMRDIYNNASIDCSDLRNKITINSNTNVFEYNNGYDNFKNIVSEYASIGSFECVNNSGSNVNIKIPITVEQLPDEVFDVDIFYQKRPS